MILSRYTAKNIISSSVAVPDETLFELPEKVLQFGTGVLLRGLPDYFIDKANRQGLFNGRIVVVKSVPGDVQAFAKQDGLFTHCILGFENGRLQEENLINASISRVLQASQHWKQVLECAHNPHLQIIISNTTEAGIQLINDDIRQHPPTSFPGKLLAFLYERYKAFAGSAQSGMVVVSAEMIPDNGEKLQAVVFELAHLNGLEDGFIEWLERCNKFCNSLVDRIVPGLPEAAIQRELESRFGYSDPLLIVSEAHRLWAIEGDASVAERLSFAAADSGVVITPDITQYRELKLRLLNGTHTLSCGLAFLAGCQTVREAMENKELATYITALMQDEIAPAIPYPVEAQLVQRYAASVLERFRNPHLAHQWLSISLNYSLKMRIRCIPLLLKYYQRENAVPERMALGFAAYLAFTHPVRQKENQFFGEFKGEPYRLQDNAAPAFYRRWAMMDTASLVHAVLADEDLWEADLTTLPGFEEAVLTNLNLLLQGRLREALAKKQFA